jgi:hypothetical protein
VDIRPVDIFAQRQHVWIARPTLKAIDQEQSLATVQHVLQVLRRLDRLRFPCRIIHSIGVVVPHRNLPERRPPKAYGRPHPRRPPCPPRSGLRCYSGFPRMGRLLPVMGFAATAESRRTVKHRADACRIWIGAPATSEGRSRRSSMGPGPPHLGDEALPATRSCRGGCGWGTDRGTPYLLLVAVPVVWPWLLRKVVVPLLLVVAVPVVWPFSLRNVVVLPLVVAVPVVWPFSL